MLSSVSRVSCFVIQNSISYPSRVPDSCETAFPLPTLFLPYLALLQPSFPFLALPCTPSHYPFLPSPSLPFLVVLFLTPTRPSLPQILISFSFLSLPHSLLHFFPFLCLLHLSFPFLILLFLLPNLFSPSPSASFFFSPSSSYLALPFLILPFLSLPFLFLLFLTFLPSLALLFCTLLFLSFLPFPRPLSLPPFPSLRVEICIMTSL